MTIKIDGQIGNIMGITMPKEDIEIRNFRNYVISVDGSELTKKDGQNKELILKIGRDGILSIELNSTDVQLSENFSLIDAYVPHAYKYVKTTFASKTIRGVKGRYRIYKNLDGDYLAFAIGPSGKAYRINLGNLLNGDSKIRKVLDAVPNVTFHKAYFNDKLPQTIIENRQPLKAALDVLEDEGYIEKTG